MTDLYGFELIREQVIPELNTHAKLYRHLKTGAELLSMENSDENKVFGVSFCTLPDDSSGLPHILEHSVLNGSRKYPIKQPFLELIKGSLQTFVNAMTYPDKTIYPVASQNLQDFYNLVDVYLDALFFPNIDPQILQQEGWHYELENLDDPLVYKGVVFNEMKGAYSSPDNLMYRYSRRALFPETVYGHDSGGDPRDIPTLSYDKFYDFYKTYYHPSNARIWFYGDDDPNKRLELMGNYLNAFDPNPADTSIPLHPRFAEPVRLDIPYAASEDGEKAMLTVNWLLPPPLDTTLAFAIEVLAYALIGTPASPLRKALIESGLGEDLTGEGLDNGLREMVFSVGMRGVELADTAQVEALIDQTLRELVQNGLDPAMIEAALNTSEFQMRELNTGSFPRGLLLMLVALNSWLYGGDPLEPLAFEKALAEVKQNLADNPRYFENLIDELLIKNQHRATVILEPDPELSARLEAEEREKLAQIRAGMSQDELQAIIDSTRALQLKQQTPDTPEALATIPRLKLSDLDTQNKLIPLQNAQIHDAELLYHDLFTNGIVYLDLAFNLYSIPQAYLPYVKLFGQALLEIGTASEDFVRLSQRIGSKTGGIRSSTLVSAIRNQDRSAAYFVLRGKSTLAQTSDLLAILRDILLTVQLDNKDRFRQMVLEAKAGNEASLVPSGHVVAMGRLGAHFGGAAWLNSSALGGIDYLFFLRQLAKDIEQDWPSVLEKLETVRRLLINQQALVVNVTLDQSNWQGFQPQLAEFIASLPSQAPTWQTWTPQSFAPYEGLTIPAQVNYVAKGANLYQLGYQFHGSALVISRYAGLAHLFERVRVQGGAYGGFCVFDPSSGQFSYGSYRDPNLLNTLVAYDDTPAFLRNLKLSQEELTSAIIGAISDIDGYQLPDAKGYTSMTRYLTGITDEMRQQMRDEILGTSPADFKRFADVLDPINSQGQIVVLGSQDAIEQANASKGEAWLQVTKVL